MDEAPLKIGMQEHVGLVEDQNVTASKHEGVQQNLEPHLIAISRPNDLLRDPASPLEVVDIEVLAGVISSTVWRLNVQIT
jgi:hypothetical protein